MNDKKCGILILDAIDQLRKRKARPDLDRICHMLERRHGLKSSAVNEELSRLVKEGTVVKVDYKGNTSYRNAAKWIKTKTQYYGSFYNSSDISSSVLDAVRSLTLPTKDQPQLRSASVSDIEQYLLKRDSQFNFNISTLHAILDKEVAKGTLHQLPSGEYIPLKANIVTEIPKKSDNGPTPPKQFKPSTDTALQESSSNSCDSSPARCDYCLFTAAANRKGDPEDLLICKDCGSKAHPSCMEYTKLLYESYPHPQNWQCPDCKTCMVCDETASSDDLLTCNICFKGYHMACHDPAISLKPTGIWFCSDCETDSKEKEKKKIKLKYHSDEENEASHQAIRNEFLKCIEEYPSSIPFAKDWTIENVESFFRYLGFEDEAPAFREQEIDGMSLLLMKRLDVLTGLGIKLGPALKIYKHILKLQSRITEN